ncbi:MAG: hypothetical protein BRC38_16015, partial [Cyanobacteria bacterium QH_6_48_35]
ENHHTITLPLLWFHYLKSAVIQLDNAKAHSAQILTVAKNVVLLFQPPYCREVNPMERVGSN